MIYLFILQDGSFPDAVKHMTGLRWLKLNHCCLKGSIPDKISSLENLEGLCMIDNSLSTLYGELITLRNLRSLICRKNNLRNANIPEMLFKLDDLSVVVSYRNVYLYL